ncbi:MAG TPA: hypothetical protein VHF25_10195 [Nitriliruptorales bacterium]|nr:hypothetical protein [Nitriliruptorales bacterium]
MITGLLEVEAGRTRTRQPRPRRQGPMWALAAAGRMRARDQRPRRRGRMPALAAATLLTAAGAVAGAAAHSAQPETATEGDLIAELVAIEEQVAGIALLPDVSVSPERTWGTVSGDFVGARVLLEDVDADLRALVAAATVQETGTADAVETVASAYRTMLQGYRYLAVYEEAGLAVAAIPAATEAPQPEPAQAADEPRGQAEVGMVLLLEALAGFHDGYTVLQDAEAAGTERTLFQARFNQVQQTGQGEADDVRDALSLPATERLVPAVRFEPRFTGEEPGRVTRYLCVDWDDYAEQRPEGPHVDLPQPEGELPDLPIADCPDPDNGNDVRLVAPGA